jgi:hypothetical protein
MMGHGFSLGAVIVLFVIAGQKREARLHANIPGNPSFSNNASSEDRWIRRSSPRMTTEYAVDKAPAGLRAHPCFL